MKARILYAMKEYAECRNDCSRGRAWYFYRDPKCFSASAREKVWYLFVLHSECCIILGEFGEATINIFKGKSHVVNWLKETESTPKHKHERRLNDDLEAMVDADITSIRRRCEKGLADLKSKQVAEQHSTTPTPKTKSWDFSKPVTTDGSDPNADMRSELLSNSLTELRQKKYRESQPFTHSSLQALDDPDGLTGRSYVATNDIKAGTYATNQFFSLKLCFTVF